MTTKYKIITGFVLMILLLGITAGSGYMDLEKASDGFVSYRRQARIDIYTSDMVTNLSQAVAKTYDFVSKGDPELIKGAHTDVREFLTLADKASEETHIDYRKQAVAELKKRAEPLDKAITNILDNMNQLTEQYEKVVRPSYDKMSEQLKGLSDNTYESNNMDSLYSSTGVWALYSDLLTALTRFSTDFQQADGEASMKRLEALKEPMQALGRQLTTSRGRQLHSDMMASYNALHAALTSMRVAAASVRGSLTDMHGMEASITAYITEFNQRVSAERGAEGEATLASNASAQKVMLAVGAVGLLLGVALAAYIIIGIVKVLSEVAAFASATAEGQFDYQVKSKEKGEIGTMIDSMRAIPATLKRVLDEYQSLELKVEDGQLLAKGNDGLFKGGFATLVRGTNAVLDRFVTVVESIPSPVVMLNADLKASYINATARRVAGDNYAGKTCFELFAREDFGTAQDGLKVAVETRQPATRETRAHPQGKNMDVEYTAIPMLTREGRLASVLQLITDLTALKEQQNTMLEVASRASDISERVAAASEQLSAQVEQVSRGAEMQRSRVESTASAMTEMNSTVLEVARNAGQASEETDTTRSKANDGAALVNRLVNAITRVNEVASQLQSNMQELGKQADGIGDVMNVISDIADQTNLLALNAAIEAARAGEAGRGFAVVADEVRKLAEKTMVATDEVGTNIRAIQQSARSNIESVATAVSNIEEANGLAGASGSALAEIVTLAESNSSIVSGIATAAEEQSATAEEINLAIDEINRIVGETTQGMLQSSDAVQSLSAMAQELRHVMEQLK